MLANIPELFFEAWLRPRQSMRRILNMQLREQDRIVMILIVAVLYGVLTSLVMRADPPVPPDGAELVLPSTLTISAAAVMMGVIGYYIQAFLIRLVGGAFGGIATPTDTRTVVAWHTFVVMLVFLVVFVVSAILPSGISLPISYAFSFASMVILAVYIAEAHGFANTWMVLGFIVTLSLLAMLALSSLVPAQMSGAVQ